MSQVPRDPRQLARDILSGKISIEELAREQARARGQKAPGLSPQMPSQRPLAPMPPPVQPPRPAMRAPAPAPRRIPQAAPRQQPRPTAVVRGPQIEIQSSQLSQPEQPSTTPPPQQSAVHSARSVAAKAGLARAVRNRTSLRQGIMLAEILGPPLALRETDRF